ncbi:hypothetical protein [Pedobacter miscanthi]|uniref:hypothetical protein n=1 Tax=Pedobacter miscanthi TaxID=2259170 RepID=UPI00131462BE|nr:hypothetical protein [Pedobacter miscanthi]
MCTISIEGIFTVIGKAAPARQEDAETRFTLLSEFAEDSLHYESVNAKEQVENDVSNAENYLNEHINEG